MSKLWVSVCFPIRVKIDFDASKIMEDDYVEEKQEEAKNIAKDILIEHGTSIRPFIHDACWRGRYSLYF